ncbi:MAG: hypothetical protein K2X99_06045 [Gemmatimonadaceae bacterium]|nr:hypothetical protein [Gemmatimonadaceae bacterium]
MTHHATEEFWSCYRALPAAVRAVADKQFDLLKSDPAHPSLHFKQIGRYRSARVGARYRALAIEVDDGFLWWWIGTHAEYDRLVG